MVDLEDKKTKETKRIEKLLLKQFPDHPGEYPPMAYRYNSASIRVRLVSERFSGLKRGQRFDLVYPLLKDNLPEDALLDITILLLLAPDEVEDSLMNREFERPTPSRL